MLEVCHLTFSYKDKPIVADLSFAIPAGKIIGLVAPNGTGKTTLLSILCGLLPVKDAQITLNGLDLKKQRTKYLRQLFFIENANRLYEDLTVLDHLNYVKNMWRTDVDIAAILTKLGMDSYKKQKIRKLSLGMKQHVLLAMYLISDAQLLLIDEPLNGLDPTSIQLFEAIFTQLKTEGKSLLISSHQMDSVGRISDEVYFLKDRKLVMKKNSQQDMMAEYSKIFLEEAAHA